MSDSRIKDFKRINTKDADLNKVQSAVRDVIKPIVNCEILDGFRLIGVVLTAGQVNKIKHNLNRDLRGWLIVRQKVNATVWEDATAQDLNKSILNLRCSSDCTVDLWVF